MTRAPLIALAAGVLLGGGLGWALGGSPDAAAPRSTAAPASKAAAKAADDRTLVPGLDVPEVRPFAVKAPPPVAAKAPPPAPAQTPADLQPKLGSVLQDVPRELDGWVATLADGHRERARERRKRARASATYAVNYGRRKQRDQALDAARGGPLARIAALRGSYDEAAKLTADEALFAELFRTQASNGSHVRLARNGMFPRLSPGDVIQVPSGAYALDMQEVGGWLRSEAAPDFPADLTFDGRHMDFSLLVFRSYARAPSAIQNLTYRDMTIWCDDHLIDARRGGFTLRLDRCRVVAFDSIATGMGAIWATSCRFESGFGRSPYRANGVVRGNETIGRWEDCTFVGPFHSAPPKGHHFVRCEFRDLAPSSSGRYDGNDARFEDCTFHFLTEKEHYERRGARARDIRELHRDWRIPR